MYYVRVYGTSSLGQTDQFDYKIKVTEGCDLVDFILPDIPRQSVAVDVGTLQIDASFTIMPETCQVLTLAYEIECFVALADTKVYECRKTDWI